MTPTTKEISDNIIAQLEASLSQSIPLLPKSFTRILAKALAGIFILIYKYAGFIFLQMFVKTASYGDTEINGVMVNPLLEWGRLIGTSDPKEATSTEMTITVTVINQTGSLDTGSQLLNTANGVTYLTVGDVLLNASTVSVPIIAASDQSGGDGSGVIGNLQIGDTVSFANPLANVNRNATVASIQVTGAEAEDIEDYRQRVLDRFQKRPQGGAYSDYELWGEEASGIINVYPYTGDAGEVNVYSEATVASSGNADGIPTTAQLEAVLALINYDDNGLSSRRNANAFVNSLPITRTGFNVTVTGITGVTNLSDVQSQITDALTEYFFEVEPYIVGLSIPPRKDRISRTSISSIVNDIVLAYSGTFTDAQFKKDGENILLSTYVLQEGEKAKIIAVVFN